MEGNKNGYTLTKKWFEWCLENREQNSPALTALYLYIIERCNSLGWKEKFGIPTEHTMYILAIGSYNTYKKHLQKLHDIGFIKIHEKSKNQFSSNIIGLSNFDEPTDEASDEPTDEPRDTLVTKQVTNHVTSLLSHNKTIKQETNKTKKPKNNNKYPSFEEFKEYALQKEKDLGFEIDLDKLRTKFIAWSENDWKNGYGKKIKNWKSTLTNSLTYLKANNNAVAKPNTPIDYKMQQHLEHDKNIRAKFDSGKRNFVYGSQMRQNQQNDN